MSRIVLLLMVMIWMGRSSAPAAARTPLLLGPSLGPVVFLAGYVLMVLGMGLWSRWTARHLGDGRAGGVLPRFNLAQHICRLLIPLWLAAGVWPLGWDRLVHAWLLPLEHWPWKGTHLELPQMLVGTAPAILAWLGLIWAQYPTERALREQSIFVNLDDDLPVREPPGLGHTLKAAVRLQLMFTLVPVLLILLVRDLTAVGIRAIGWPDPQGQENWVILPATLAIFVLAPELLRRVLRTEPLADGPLRRRLEQMCRDSKLKYRQILLWHTDGTMGNAAVMGIIAPVRYILLSDLLLETMTERQVEAVFAHELGHVVHKHILWYGVFALMIMGFLAGPGDMFLLQVQHWVSSYADAHRWGASGNLWNDIQGTVVVVIAMGSFLLAFGYLSPRFERQADVYAARTMQKIGGTRVTAMPAAGSAGATDLTTYTPARSYVGEYGAGVFASALHRVATINNIPVAARNWSHGSIAQRMRYLQEISGDPKQTHRFDRVMNRLYATLLVALGTFGVWGAVHSSAADAESTPANLRVVSPAANGR